MTLLTDISWLFRKNRLQSQSCVQLEVSRKKMRLKSFDSFILLFLAMMLNFQETLGRQFRGRNLLLQDLSQAIVNPASNALQLKQVSLSSWLSLAILDHNLDDNCDFSRRDGMLFPFLLSVQGLSQESSSRGFSWSFSSPFFSSPSFRDSALLLRLVVVVPFFLWPAVCVFLLWSSCCCCQSWERWSSWALFLVYPRERFLPLLHPSFPVFAFNVCFLWNKT